MTNAPRVQLSWQAVIVAAGSSQRFGDSDKLFADLCGRPVLAWSLGLMLDSAPVFPVVVVASAANRERVEALASSMTSSRRFQCVEGGARRRDSVEAGLRVCEAPYVAVHDGARPLASLDLVRRVAAAAFPDGAAPGVPVVDTIARVGSGGIARSHVDRRALRALQTPQVVPRTDWLAAAASSEDEATDDTALLARAGRHCRIVDGEVTNLKITRPLDLVIAREILKETGRCTV